VSERFSLNGESKPQPRRVPSVRDGALPPQNIDAEMGVIGSMLLDNRVIDELTSFLQPEHFYRDSHQILCRAIYELHAGSKPVDVHILAEELNRKNQYKSIGGDDAIALIFDQTPHAANALHYGLIVKNKAIKRRHIELAHILLAQGYSDEVTAEETQKDLEQMAFAIAEERATRDVVFVGDLIGETLRELDKRQAGETNGLGSGMPDLDVRTGGFKPGRLYYVAARTGVGKTAFALNIADHLGVDFTTPVFFLSLEMSRDELMDRLVCCRAMINTELMQAGELSKDDLEKAHRTRRLIEKAPLMLNDTENRPARLTINQIASIARRTKLRHGMQIMIVDYIQLIDAENERETRQVQIGKSSRGLKKLAQELKIPIIVLSQLNRGIENREDRRPRLSDLRESGDQEQDADMVILLHREHAYDRTVPPSETLAIVAKNRHGAKRDVKLHFNAECMKFLRPAMPWQDDDPPLSAF
jgi:replicative DNA helicase